MDLNGVVRLERYEVQRERWPDSGKHILAQYNDESILVYQAYSREIGNYAVENQRLLGAPGYSDTRMTWIKTQFLWMMYRSNWGLKDNNQAVTLGIWLRREAFERYLSLATTHGNSTNDANQGTVRLQWDPDHHPSGSPHPRRRAIQLGLKGIESFLNGNDIVRIQNLSDLVSGQQRNAASGSTADLLIPFETIYPVSQNLQNHLQMNIQN